MNPHLLRQQTVIFYFYGALNYHDVNMTAYNFDKCSAVVVYVKNARKLH